MRGRMIFPLLFIVLACVLSCSKKKPTEPPAPNVQASPTRIIGTWTGSGYTLVVGSNYLWRGWGQERWSCSINGAPASCSYDVDVSGTVQPGTTYSISATSHDRYGNLASIAGSWNAAFDVLTGSASAATSSGGHRTLFAMQKVGE
jgi:hypothetical protein